MSDDDGSCAGTGFGAFLFGIIAGGALLALMYYQMRDTFSQLSSIFGSGASSSLLDSDTISKINKATSDSLKKSTIIFQVKTISMPDPPSAKSKGLGIQVLTKFNVEIFKKYKKFCFIYGNKGKLKYGLFLEQDELDKSNSDSLELFYRTGSQLLFSKNKSLINSDFKIFNNRNDIDTEITKFAEKKIPKDKNMSKDEILASVLDPDDFFEIYVVE